MKIVIFMLILNLSSCAVFEDMSVEGRHNSWLVGMQLNIGKNMYDCRYWICLHRKGNLFLGDTVLANGNLEAGYIWGHTQPKCRYYYEYNSKTGSIINFRFEESERFACRVSGA